MKCGDTYMMYRRTPGPLVTLHPKNVDLHGVFCLFFSFVQEAMEGLPLYNLSLRLVSQPHFW
jgi:hypothetical protein